MDTFQNAGCNGIIVTVDQQASYYERTQQDRNFGGRVTPAGGRGVGAGGGTAAAGSARYRLGGGRLWYTWQYIDAVRKMIKGPLVIKGILDPEDAKLAIEHGADAIIVSNHGGRSMDYGPSSLEVLPEIVAAVNGRIPVLFDSGIRRGADIFKALALGANGVMIGRTTRWGLAAFGTAGAQRLIEILQQELVRVAAAAGCAKLSDISKTKVKANFV
jgi:isopentenyl diphosphate isomerase/L-lactate dehydrogenase-like FMN-dependent dehydrogenase